MLATGSCLAGGVQVGDPSLVSLAFCPVSRGQAVLGYTEAELCSRGSGYQFLHVGDLMYCAESHVRSEYWAAMGVSAFVETLAAPCHCCSSGHAYTVAPCWAEYPGSGAAVIKS